MRGCCGSPGEQVDLKVRPEERWEESVGCDEVGDPSISQERSDDGAGDPVGGPERKRPGGGQSVSQPAHLLSMREAKRQLTPSSQ